MALVHRMSELSIFQPIISIYNNGFELYVDVHKNLWVDVCVSMCVCVCW